MNYEEYHFGFFEWCLLTGQGILLLGLLTYVFYRSLFAFVLFLPLGFFYPLYKRGDRKQKRLETLRVQFKDAILILASSLNAGYSVENAFVSSLEELDRIYGADSMISKEIRLIIRKTRMNLPVGEALKDFADRSGIDDVENFAEVFVAARKSGGELMKIISQTAQIIGEKIRIHEEILTMTASKRLEQRIMSVVPMLLVFYIEMTSPGFFQVLYTTLQGRILMTLCLLAYLLSLWVTEKILEIAV